MKKLLTAVSMALALVTAVAMSAYCANVAGEVSGLSRQPLSGVQLSLANPSVQMLARAGSGSGGDPMLTLVANDDKQNPPGHDKGHCQDGKHDDGHGHCDEDCKDGEHDDGHGHCDQDHCKDGEHDDGHDHCVNSSSE